jgi:hypothetical protein
MHSYANPRTDNNNAAGFGIVRFRKSTREIVLECWPRHVDVTDPKAEQFAGWPITIRQEDNYHRAALAWLPTLVVQGQDDPVVQIIDETTNDIVYTLRINGKTWRPKVFREGTYTIRVGESSNVKEFHGVMAEPEESTAKLEVAL